jgi:hypothetical protein
MTENFPAELRSSWRPFFGYAYDKDGPREHTYLGDRSIRRCRFCGTTAPNVTFRKDAHIIPAAFGNRTLFSLEECDECNELVGSPLENDLAAFLTIERAMGRMRSRKGGVKFRHPGRDSFIESHVDSNTVKLSLTIDETEIRTEQVDGALQISAEIPPHRPVNVAKALARMGLFVVGPNDLAALDHVRRWVRGEVEWLPTVFHTIFVPGPGLRHVRLVVAKADAPALPPYIVLFGFSTRFLAIHLPDASWTLPADLPLPPFRGISPYPPHTPSATKLTVTKDELVRGRRDSVRVAYQSKREVTEVELRRVLEGEG